MILDHPNRLTKSVNDENITHNIIKKTIPTARKSMEACPDTTNVKKTVITNIAFNLGFRAVRRNSRSFSTQKWRRAVIIAIFWCGWLLLVSAMQILTFWSQARLLEIGARFDGIL
jgi:hypothetical protein